MRLMPLYRIGRFALLSLVMLAPASTFAPVPSRPDSTAFRIEASPGAPLPGGTLITGGLERFPQWDRVRRFMLDQHSFRSAELRQWRRWAASLRDRPLRDRLAAINARVNARFAYADDRAVWQRANYWEDPLEVVREGRTDCEGFAILKMYLAIAAGIDRRDLAIVVGRIADGGVYHAVLLARAGQKGYALDNRWNALRTADSSLHFLPLYALDTGQAWSYPAAGAARQVQVTAVR